MKSYLKFLPLFFTLFIATNSDANYFSGAGIHWEKVANDSFKVTLTVYRDCNQNSYPTLSLDVSSLCGKKQPIKLTQSQAQDITPTCTGGCTKCSSSSCSYKYGYESMEYVAFVNFSSWRKLGCCEVNLSVQTCCRSEAITTGTARSKVYTEATLNACLSGDNSSPKFVKRPDFICCVGRDYIRNCAAMDQDRDSISRQLSDSLVYSIAQPKSSSTQYAPWTTGYSYDKPVYYLGFPKQGLSYPRGFHLDSFSGILKFRPMKEDNTIIAVKVEEYRNGKKIGEVIRESQLTIIKCVNNKPPEILGIDSQKYSFEIDACISQKTCFNVSAFDPDSTDTLSYHYTTNIPGLAGQSLKKLGPANKIPFCIAPDSTAINGQYYIDLYVQDDNCPIIGKTFHRILVNVKNSLGTFSIKKEGDYCGEFRYSIQNTSQPITDSVYWYLDGQKIGSSLGDFNYQFIKEGRYKLEGFIQDCFNTSVSDSIIITKKTLEKALNKTAKFIGLRDTTFCYDDQLTLPLHVKSGSSLQSIRWNRNKGNFSNASITTDTSRMTLRLNNNSINPVHLSMDLYATNKDGCFDKKTVTITVNPNRNLKYFQDITYCDIKDSIFLLPSIHAPSSWSGDHVINDSMYHLNKNSPDSQLLFYKGISSTICYYDTIAIKALKKPVATWQSDTLLCAGSDDILLLGLGSGQWKGDLRVDTSDSRIAFFHPSRAGEFTVHYEKTALQIENCEFGDSIIITVNEMVNPILSRDTTLCLHSENLLLKSQGKGTWYGNNMENDNEFKPIEEGSFIFVFQPNTVPICYIKSHITISVGKNSNEIKIADTFSVCVNNGAEQSLIGNTKNGSWIGKDKASSTPIINFHSSDYSPGHYDFIYTDRDDTYNCPISDTTVVEINQLPKIDFSLAQNKVELGKNLKINNLGNKNYTYNWNIQGSSEGKTNDFEPNVKMDELGWFNVRVIATNPQTTCSDTLALKGVVEVIDPSSTGESYYSNLIDLYPNPSSDQITIENHGNQAIHFQLYDLSGKTVKSIMLKSGQTAIDLSELAKGFYQAQFSLGNSHWMEKVVKK